MSGPPQRRAAKNAIMQSAIPHGRSAREKNVTERMARCVLVDFAR